jgi:hypothetical protein
VTRPTHRYGPVLLVAVTVLLATAALPSGDMGTVAVLVLEGLLLRLAIGTSGVRSELLLSVATLLAVLATGSAIIGAGVPGYLANTLGGLFVGMALFAVAQGGFATLRERGVTIQVVVAGLTVYVLFGLLFANAMAPVAGADPGDYFAQGTDGTAADRAYFSFMTLTTTGFGDLTPAAGAGRAIAMFEVLVGQIYLVTVVALLVGGLAGRRSPPPSGVPGGPP